MININMEVGNQAIGLVMIPSLPILPVVPNSDVHSLVFFVLQHIVVGCYGYTSGLLFYHCRVPGQQEARQGVDVDVFV